MRLENWARRHRFLIRFTFVSSRPMKVNAEIDWTPEEARAFFGLPDVQPMQAKVMAEMERRMLTEMDRFSPEALMKSWMSLVPQSPEQFQDAFMRMF